MDEWDRLLADAEAFARLRWAEDCFAIGAAEVSHALPRLREAVSVARAFQFVFPMEVPA